MNDILTQLDTILAARKSADADNSYVASLHHKGLNKILEKVGEECTETLIAAKDAEQSGDNKDLISETAVLAMLKLSHKDKSWEEMSREIPIVPISMSYEEIPLDTLMVKDHLGMIDKSDNQRDSSQIFSEIGEQKRRIHIHVSPRIIGCKRGDLVRNLDSGIIRGTHIWQSNKYAAELLKTIGSKTGKPVQWMKDKLVNQDESIRNALLQLYAAPAINLQKILSRD